jgi:putative acetyltransferase
MTIRRETPGDIASVYKINTAAFGRNAEADLVDALRQSGNLVLSIVAEVADDNGTLSVIAHVGFSPMTLLSPDGERQYPTGIWGMGPVAVMPAYQQQGMGSAIVRGALETARADGAEIIFLLGNPAFYGRFGFQLARDFELRWEHGAESHFQVYAYHEDRLTDLSGKGLMVCFSPEFDGV